MKAHVIGICGAGMSAVAHLLHQSGYEVSGSDAGFYPPISDYLKELGFPLYEGYAAENIPADVDLVMIGMNAKLRADNNPEVAFAFDQYKDKIKSFPEVLAMLTAAHNRIVVAGSYGKSTLTSMIAWVLLHAGKDPGYFIGAIPKNFDRSSDMGHENGAFIFEGDEYPSAHFDARSKFEHYRPTTLVLTSASHDHVNVFPTLDDYHAPFLRLIGKLRDNMGMLVACTSEENAARLAAEHSVDIPSVFYGLTKEIAHKKAPIENDFYAANIDLAEISSFDLMGPVQGNLNANGRYENLGRIQTNQLGLHNIENIVGAAACLLAQNMVSFEEFAAAIKEYQGITRRLDKKSEKTNLPIYEGFGSSYEKGRSAIAAIKAHFPDHEIHIVFEPHTFTWRNKNALHYYETAFDDTAKVWLYAPPSQGADSHDQLTLEEIYEKSSQHHADVSKFDASNFQQIIDLTNNKTVLLLLSSGNFDGLLQKTIQYAEEKRPA